MVSEDDEELEAVVSTVIRIPRTHDALTPILASMPLQLLAYPVAALRDGGVAAAPLSELTAAADRRP